MTGHSITVNSLPEKNETHIKMQQKEKKNNKKNRGIKAEMANK